jgi:hypothetical protein
VWPWCQDIAYELPVALDLGSGAGHLARALVGVGTVSTLHALDASSECCKPCGCKVLGLHFAPHGCGACVAHCLAITGVVRPCPCRVCLVCTRCLPEEALHRDASELESHLASEGGYRAAATVLPHCVCLWSAQVWH